MAVKITSAYVGEVLTKILIKATTGNEIVNRGLVRMVPNVNDKYYIPRMKSGNMLQKRKEQPTDADSQGDFTLDEKMLEPKELMAFTTFNPRSFENIWREFQPTGDLNFKQLPQYVQSALLEEMAKVVDFELGYHFINGKFGAGEGQYFDGLLTRMFADSEVLRPDKTKLSANASVTEKLGLVYKTIPKTIRSNKGLRILMSVEDADIYDDELTALPNKGADPTSTNIKRFKGITIEALAEWPEGVIVATVTGQDLTTNLWIAVNTVNDFSAIKVGLLTNSGEKYFFKMLMKADTNIAFGEEVVLLDTRPVNPASNSAQAPAPKKANTPAAPAESETGEAEAGTIETNPADENK